MTNKAVGAVYCIGGLAGITATAITGPQAALTAVLIGTVLLILL